MSRLPAIYALTPGANLESHLATISGIPVLSVEEERELTHRLHYQQDLEAARLLVMSHLRFVVHIARSYSGYGGLNQADLIQEGNVGLMKAVKRFNPEMGVRLVSFAVHWIKAEIHEFIIRNWRIVKIATAKRSASCSLTCVARKTLRLAEPRRSSIHRHRLGCRTAHRF